MLVVEQHFLKQLNIWCAEVERNGVHGEHDTKEAVENIKKRKNTTVNFAKAKDRKECTKCKALVKGWLVKEKRMNEDIAKCQETKIILLERR